jgi:hypothetical protein
MICIHPLKLNNIDIIYNNKSGLDVLNPINLV